MTRTALLASAACALLAAPAAAHHSNAAFDMDKRIQIEGRLVEVSWKNPHIYLAVETMAADGMMEVHDIEAASVSVLQPLGLTRDSLTVGEHVVVMAAPSRRAGNRTAFGLTLSTDDGVVRPLSPLGARAAPPSATAAEDLSGTWLASSEAFLGYIQGIADWPLTDDRRAAALAAFAAPNNAPNTMAECVPAPPPVLMLYPVLMQIGGSETEAVIDVDMMSAHRVIHLDETEHPDDLEPSLLGHSIGRWEDGALVVDTVGFTESPHGLSVIAASGPDKHLVERFSLGEDGRSLAYRATLTDPDGLTAPVTLASDWAYRPDLEPSGLACDPEIAQRYLVEEAAP
jgi:hypothetical protein